MVAEERMKRAESEELKEVNLEKEALFKLIEKENRVLRLSLVHERHLHVEDIPLPRSSSPQEYKVRSMSASRTGFASVGEDGADGSGRAVLAGRISRRASLRLPSAFRTFSLATRVVTVVGLRPFRRNA